MKLKFYFILAILLALFLRTYLISLVTNRGDISVHFDWSRTIYQIGLKGSYSYPIWVSSPPTQPPLMMANFWTSRHLYQNRYLLAELHNLTKIPPASIILWFDKYGESILLRLWAMIGDIVSSLFIFWALLHLKINKKIAFVGFLAFLFNPISLFITSVWGQNDIYAASFVLLSFLFLYYQKYRFFSPFFFVLSLLAKPTSLIVAPLYSFCYLSLLNFKNLKEIIISLCQTLLSFVLSLSLAFIAFLPFVSHDFINDIIWILTNRISNASKGISLASVSAFNLYSLFFKIDSSPGTIKFLALSLDSYSMIFYLLINIIALYLLIKYRKNKNKLPLFVFLLFFVTQGSFLFMTSMLERYFIIAFAPAIILTFLYSKKIAFSLIFQQLLWLLNLLYAFYWRDYFFIKTIFLGQNNLLVKVLSLLSLLNFFYISKVFLSLIKKDSLKTTAS